MINKIWEGLKERVFPFFIWEGRIRIQDKDRLIDVYALICGEIGKKIVVLILYDTKIVIFYDFQFTFGQIIEYLEKNLKEGILQLEKGAENRIEISETQNEIIIGESAFKLSNLNSLDWIIRQIINYIKRS